MGSLVYSAGCSLDGYINDADGEFQWSAPTAETFEFIIGKMRRIRLELYGRRTYELMTVWETDPSLAAYGLLELQFAEWWSRTPKIVYSTTLPEEGIITRNARLARHFDPAEVRQLKEDTFEDISIFGPTLAAHAFEAGLVDEIELFVLPVMVGDGTRALPPEVLSLELCEQHRFHDDTIYVRYRVRR
ncbi:MAG TPA: dihydrofolate reductase family protein [Actinomycetaceae bacterium]|nr:dihydrofolate reductase family protein [Actinomycetaceae bacterium]